MGQKFRQSSFIILSLTNNIINIIVIRLLYDIISIFIRWNVAAARCTLPLLDVNRTISEMFELILYNCLVIYLPPTNIFLTPRSYCYTTQVISSCNETGLMDTYDVQFGKQCNASCK